MVPRSNSFNLVGAFTVSKQYLRCGKFWNSALSFQKTWGFSRVICSSFKRLHNASLTSWLQPAEKSKQLSPSKLMSGQEKEESCHTVRQWSCDLGAPSIGHRAKLALSPMGMCSYRIIYPHLWSTLGLVTRSRCLDTVWELATAMEKIKAHWCRPICTCAS